MSPYGKVPILQVEEGTIWESAAINQYVDEKWAGGRLMGSDPYKRALHRVWTHWCVRVCTVRAHREAFGHRRS